MSYLRREVVLPVSDNAFADKVDISAEHLKHVLRVHQFLGDVHVQLVVPEEALDEGRVRVFAGGVNRCRVEQGVDELQENRRKKSVSPRNTPYAIYARQ